MKYLTDHFMLIKEKIGTLEILVSCPIKTEMMKTMITEIMQENKGCEGLKTESVEYAYNYVNKEGNMAKLYHFNHFADGTSERFILKAASEILNYVKENLNNTQNKCKEVNEK